MNFKFKAYRHNQPIHFHFNRKIKVGILGGSFNPAHEGHLHVSFIAKKQLNLNEIWWLVTPQNRLKQDKISDNYFQRLKGMSDSNAIDELKLLYGIGQWSAEMFLIFYFNRKNILPLGDIGLINSFCNNYKVKRNMFLSNIKKYKKLWDPYCTVATWYLWRDIDEDVVQY